MEDKSEVKLKDYYIPDSILLPGSNYYIPDSILLPGSKEADDFHTPTCPVIVFINSKSGGQLGGELLRTYRSLLNGNQVFDLGEKAPDVVLLQLYANIEILKKVGDKLASEIDKRLRIIVAGGDGTASWLLGVISDLKLPRPPPFATVPLARGNNLPFSFGWVCEQPASYSLYSFQSTPRERRIPGQMLTLCGHSFTKLVLQRR